MDDISASDTMYIHVEKCNYFKQPVKSVSKIKRENVKQYELHGKFINKNIN